MNSEDLRKAIEESSDKLSIFRDKDRLVQYDCKVIELLDFISEFLDDEQKAKLFEFEHFKNASSRIKSGVIESIYDNSIKLNLLENHDITSEIPDYELVKIINTLDDKSKMQILHKPNFFKEHGMDEFDIKHIIMSLNNEMIAEILNDKDLIENKLHLGEYQITELIEILENEDIKLQMIEHYELDEYRIKDVLKTFSDKSKTNILNENKYNLDAIYLTGICSTLNVEALVEFCRENKEFFAKNNIKIYEVIKQLSKDAQLEFISKFENADLTLSQKRQILAILKPETKKEIDTSNFPTEYASAIKIQVVNDFSDRKRLGKIIVDFSEDLEIYRGLDELIYINPMDETLKINKQKLFQLCEICPEIVIDDELGLTSSTAEEYRYGENWIESVLQGINEEWSNIQKIAYIDNAIGKRISYTPDFDTEVCNEADARALWKIMHSGYGVCNGIAQVEQYILNRVGIDAEMISGKNHSFLKIKNVELPTVEGGQITGDTILDPTWNLTAHRYGGKPNNFCRSYEEIRKHDITEDGTDLECHKNDEELASATLELDEQSLRRIFTSIGLADKDGSFPIGNLMDQSKVIDDQKLPEEESIKQQFLLLSKYCPEFATCQNSTIDVLQDIILNQENFKFNKCVADRVYAREDESKRPVLYVYVDFPDSGKKFYFADKEIGQFIELPEKEFESRFECYEMDMENRDGHRPWEEFDRKENVEDLTRSSGKVVASEGDER